MKDTLKSLKNGGGYQEKVHCLNHHARRPSYRGYGPFRFEMVIDPKLLRLPEMNVIRLYMLDSQSTFNCSFQ